MRISSTALRLVAGIGLMLAVAAAALVAHAAISGGSSPRTTRASVPGSLAAFPMPSGGSGQQFDGTRAVASRLGPGESLVARAPSGAVRIFAAAGSSQGRLLRGLAVGNHHAPLVFLVQRRVPGWLEVELPVRPDHSTGWIRAQDVELAVTAYRVEVKLETHRLLVWRANRLVATEPIATGQAVTPTPHGGYFIADLLRPPDPNGFYGPYAFGLSAYSNVLTSFAGGDGQIGIHGTNDSSALGTDVSHGCIRLSNQAITRLAREIPLGTPVTIA